MIPVTRTIIQDFDGVDSEPNTVKPVYNDHLYDKIYYMWFIQ